MQFLGTYQQRDFCPEPDFLLHPAGKGTYKLEAAGRHIWAGYTMQYLTGDSPLGSVTRDTLDSSTFSPRCTHAQPEAIGSVQEAPGGTVWPDLWEKVSLASHGDLACLQIQDLSIVPQGMSA